MQRIGKLIHFITKPLILLHIILILQWGIFMGTTLDPYMQKIPGVTYVLLRGHLVYSSYIRQAKDGAWSLKMTHTTRETPAVTGHLFFIFLGKIAAVFNIDPPTMYIAARMLAAVLLFWSTYWFVSVLLPPAIHSLALFFILALEPGPMLSTISWNPALWIPSIFSYYPQIVSFRHFGLPHHTLGEAIGLALLTLCILTVRRPSAKKFILLAITGFIGTMILPPYFVMLCLAVFVPWLMYGIFSKKLKRIFPAIVAPGILIALALVIIKITFSVGYPWKDFNLDEKRWVTNSDALISYLSTLLLYIPWIAAGILTFKTLWKQIDSALRQTVILMAAWVIIPALLVPVSSYPWFPLANFRLMDGYNYAPAGILAALGFWSVMQRFKRPALRNFLSGFAIMGIALCSVYLTKLYTTQSIIDHRGVWSNVYVANDNYRAFQYLNTVPKMSGVMVSNHFGEIIPEYASVRTFLGSTPGFIDWDERYRIVQAFFSGNMSVSQARETLRKEDIQYVFYGSSEKYWNATGTLYPELLTPVFDSPVVTVFKVR